METIRLFSCLISVVTLIATVSGFGFAPVLSSGGLPATFEDPQLDVSYGPHPHQVFDAYLLSNSSWSEVEKVVLIVHGGGWGGRSKEDMFNILVVLATLFPDYGFVNMGYRLGTNEYPGYPKQLDDIQIVVNWIRQQAGSQVEIAVVGLSAGGHLSMLYAYRTGWAYNVKAVVNIVGPTDFTDPWMINHPETPYYYMAFVGPYLYHQAPELHNITSPMAWADYKSAPTIQFMGMTDPLIPITQGTLLKERLDVVGVPNELVYYPGGHADWPLEDWEDFMDKVAEFFAQNF